MKFTHKSDTINIAKNCATLSHFTIKSWDYNLMLGKCAPMLAQGKAQVMNTNPQLLLVDLSMALCWSPLITELLATRNDY